MKNVNRLVWANGFTNDKTAYSNKEPYQKTCNKCNKRIWMNPTKSGWSAIDNDGKPHECKLKKKKLKIKKCRYCDGPIIFKKHKDKWLPHNKDGNIHKCTKNGDSHE